MAVSHRHYLLLSSISCLCLISIALWAYTAHPFQSFYGEPFIVDEWHLLPFVQFKPITLMIFFGFAAWAFFLEGVENWFKSLDKGWIRLLMVIVALVSFGSLYELFFNFTIWGSLMVITDVQNPDILVNRFPVEETAVYLVYASKLVLLIFAVSTYMMYFLLRTYLSNRRPIN